jgi:hypothetical protein
LAEAALVMLQIQVQALRLVGKTPSLMLQVLAHLLDVLLHWVGVAAVQLRHQAQRVLAVLVVAAGKLPPLVRLAHQVKVIRAALAVQLMLA